MDQKQEEVAKELLRQQEEAKKIGRLIRVVIEDMCRSRKVSYMTIPSELTAHSLSMLRIFHQNVHNSMIEEHGADGYASFDDAFSNIAMKHFLDTGEKIQNDDSPPSIFDILSGDKLTNQNLAKCLFMKDGISVERPSETGFLASLAGDNFKIKVSVFEDVISFYYHLDELWDEDTAMKCMRYNSKTNLVKAHLVNDVEEQIHYTYIHPHNGSINVTNIKNIIIQFINEDKNATIS